MSSIKELQERMKKLEQNRMEDIYSACAEKGIPKRYANAFYYRIMESPLEQTESVISVRARSVKYVSDNLRDWETYLQIMIKLFPNHVKVGEWRKSLKLLEINRDKSKKEQSK